MISAVVGVLAAWSLISFVFVAGWAARALCSGSSDDAISASSLLRGSGGGGAGFGLADGSTVDGVAPDAVVGIQAAQAREYQVASGWCGASPLPPVVAPEVRP